MKTTFYLVGWDATEGASYPKRIFLDKKEALEFIKTQNRICVLYSSGIDEPLHFIRVYQPNELPL